MKSPENII